MCLIAWNWQPQSDMPLLLLGNRDEFYARPALPLHWWEGEQVLAGRDMQAGGTWMGWGRGGRLAALTNFRQAAVDTATRPSRGELTVQFLQGHATARQYLQALAPQAQQYNPFNLLLWDGQELLGLESRHRRIVTMEPGIGAVSNADFGTPWPKLQQLQAGLLQQCETGRTAASDLLPLLQNRQTAADAELPQTGVALELERTLSSIFITSSTYGTRVSSVVMVKRHEAAFHEQSYDGLGVPLQGLVTHELTM